MSILSVVIPVYNERRHIEALLRAVQSVNLDKELILVDDGSTDGTTELIRDVILTKSPEIRFFRHESNRGKGAAIRTGIAQVKGALTIIQDADLEYDPQDYARLVSAFCDSEVKVVYGSRFLSGRRVTHPFHLFVNKVITVFGNILYGAKLTDLETCYKMFRTDFLQSLELTSNGFEIEAELTSKVLKSKIAIPELPVSYRGRNYDEGKKITWVDGFNALWTLFKLRFF